MKLQGLKFKNGFLNINGNFVKISSINSITTSKRSSSIKYLTMYDGNEYELHHKDREQPKWVFFNTDNYIREFSIMENDEMFRNIRKAYNNDSYIGIVIVISIIIGNLSIDARITDTLDSIDESYGTHEHISEFIFDTIIGHEFNDNAEINFGN